MSGPNIINELKIHKTTLGDFSRFLREIIVLNAQNNPIRIGGLGKTVAWYQRESTTVEDW